MSLAHSRCALAGTEEVQKLPFLCIFCALPCFFMHFLCFAVLFHAFSMLCHAFSCIFCALPCFFMNFLAFSWPGYLSFDKKLDWGIKFPIKTQFGTQFHPQTSFEHAKSTIAALHAHPKANLRCSKLSLWRFIMLNRCLCPRLWSLTHKIPVPMPSHTEFSTFSALPSWRWVGSKLSCPLHFAMLFSLTHKIPMPKIG